MKTRILVLTSIVLLFIFTGCEKDTNADLKTDKKTVNLKLINEVKLLSSPTDQRLAYNLLSPAEKETLWKQKLTDLIKTDTLTEQQRRHIEKLDLFIKSSMFENANEDKTSVVSFAKSWCIQGLEYFTKEEISKIAFNINNANSNDIKFKSGSVDPNYVKEIKSCNCNTTSAWSCGSCWASDTCTQAVNCGFLWNSTCDGRCSSST